MAPDGPRRVQGFNSDVILGFGGLGHDDGTEGRHSGDGSRRVVGHGGRGGSDGVDGPGSSDGGPFAIGHDLDGDEVRVGIHGSRGRGESGPGSSARGHGSNSLYSGSDAGGHGSNGFYGGSNTGGHDVSDDSRGVGNGNTGSRVTCSGGGNVTGSNAATLLRSREIGLARSSRTFFRGKGLAPGILIKKQDMDLYSHKEELVSFQRFLRKRSAIVDILAIQDVVIVRSNGGLAAAFSRVTNKLITYLNQGCFEDIQTVFYNRYRDSLMIVSSHGTDGFMSRRCRNVSTRLIGRENLDQGSIFREENFTWPGFIEFDDINGIALIKNERTYRIFDLKTYFFKHQFSAINVDTVLCRPQVLLVTYMSSVGHIPLEFKSIENGETVNSMYITGSEKVQCLDIIGEKLLIKQRYKNLQVVDLISLEQSEEEISDFMFEPLYGRNVFLSFHQKSTEVRDSNGQIVRTFENHVLTGIDLIENKVCITQEQDIVISACTSEGASTESVRISCIDSGRLLSIIHPNVKITALSYNNELKETYVGTASGIVQVWSV